MDFEMERRLAEIEQAKKRILAQTDETLDVGTGIGKILHEQTEQLKRIDKMIENTDKNLTASEKLVHKIRYWIPRKAPKAEKTIPDTNPNSGISTEKYSDSRTKKEELLSRHFTENQFDCVDDSEFYDTMSKKLQKLKQMLLDFNDTLTENNETIDRLNTNVDILNPRIRKTTRDMKKIT